MRFVKIPVIVSTVPDLSFVVIGKWHRDNRETISIVMPQLPRVLTGSLYFGVCVCVM